MLLRSVGWLLIAVVTVLGACGTSASGASGAKSSNPETSSPSRVVVDIYSGRPNPEWIADSTTIHALTDAINTLPAAAAGSAPPPTGLGFRGIDVSDVATKYGAAKSVSITATLVIVKIDDAHLVTLDDSGSAALKALLPEIRQHVSAQIASVIQDAMK